jgi:hypothetical protein
VLLLVVDADLKDTPLSNSTRSPNLAVNQMFLLAISSEPPMDPMDDDDEADDVDASAVDSERIGSDRRKLPCVLMLKS